MKTLVGKLKFLRLRLFLNSPPIRQSTICTSTRNTTTTTKTPETLTEEEITQINAIIPRLCSKNHLKPAVDLISAALSNADPPFSSLPLETLVNRLAIEPDLTLPLHLLNFLKFNNHISLLPVVKMFVSTFFRNGEPKRAVKVFQWVMRPDFPVERDLKFYETVVEGLCRSGMVLECVRVVRVMAGQGVVIGNEVRGCVYRGLLRDARVREALELDKALSDGCDSGVVDMLDRMIENWVD